MKEPKDLTAEDFLEPWKEWDGLGKVYTLDTYKGAIDFAKYHVKQALQAVYEVQNLKEVQGYPGALTSEELDNVYSLDNIK